MMLFSNGKPRYVGPFAFGKVVFADPDTISLEVVLFTEKSVSGG